jgi:hypothetical protein
MVNISRNTSQVCGMMGNKANATHQAVSRYIQSAHKKHTYFVPNALSWSNSRCITNGFIILIYVHADFE